MSEKANENKGPVEADKPQENPPVAVVNETKAAPKVVKDKYVTVKSKITGNFYVGAGWLSLEKGEEIEVTQDQRRCLEESDAIYL